MDSTRMFPWQSLQKHAIVHVVSVCYFHCAINSTDSPLACTPKRCIFWCHHCEFLEMKQYLRNHNSQWYVILGWRSFSSRLASCSNSFILSSFNNLRATCRLNQELSPVTSGS